MFQNNMKTNDDKPVNPFGSSGDSPSVQPQAQASDVIVSGSISATVVFGDQQQNQNLSLGNIQQPQQSFPEASNTPNAEGRNIFGSNPVQLQSSLFRVTPVHPIHPSPFGTPEKHSLESNQQSTFTKTQFAMNKTDQTSIFSKGDKSVTATSSFGKNLEQKMESPSKLTTKKEIIQTFAFKEKIPDPPPNPFAKVSSNKDLLRHSPTFSFTKPTKNTEPNYSFLSRTTPEHQPMTSAASLFTQVNNPTAPTLVFGSSVKTKKSIPTSVPKTENVPTPDFPSKSVFSATHTFGTFEKKSSGLEWTDQKSGVFKSSATGAVFGSKFRGSPTRVFASEKIEHSKTKDKPTSSEEPSKLPRKSRSEIQQERQKELIGTRVGKLYSDQVQVASSRLKTERMTSERKPLDLHTKPLTDKVGSKALKSPTVKSKVQTSPEEISTMKTVVLTCIPKELNNRPFLSKHFSTFGKVESVKCSIKKEHALITFKNHESAKKAKTNGRILSTDYPPIFIFWAGSSNKRKDTLRQSKVEAELDSMRPELLSSSSKSRPKIPGNAPLPKLSTKKTALESEMSPIKKKVDKDEALNAILESLATNNGDRYRILDARDKLMRMKLTKQSDLATATALKGTCPDMCPEKERYSRADQFALSYFEMKPQESLNSVVMDPKAVLKEYSRSSADQEEPLPHELRPVDVLCLTMNHLLCNVLDHAYSQGESAMVGEWFDFIWNRTRAIRKDITQQHLCDLQSVSLVEKCARFHIHCSEVLVEEEANVFDPKINTENLTKCLQTLKHFYPDLEEKGVICPNEAEFRAYEILLNLNESDIASQVQQLRKDIRESAEVKFASNVFQALNSNNYVRFFRLVHQTSYLNACLLHRYFTQIRLHAMRAILKAYGKANQTENFPLFEVQRLLAFEGPGEVQQFCFWLQLNIVDDNIQLNKAYLGTPESAATLTRARLLIESKRNCIVGEIVNGAPLADNPYLTYTPHESFNEQGRLKKVAFDAQDQAGKGTLTMNEPGKVSILPASSSEMIVLPSTAVTTVGISFPQPSIVTTTSAFLKFTSAPPVFSSSHDQSNNASANPPVSFVAVPPRKATLTQEQLNTFAYETCQSILAETVACFTIDISTEVLFDLNAQDSATKLLLEVTGNLIKPLCKEVVAEGIQAKQLEEKLQRQHCASKLITDEIVDEVTKDEIQKISRIVHKELHEEWLTELGSQIRDELLDETIEEILRAKSSIAIEKELQWKVAVAKFVERKQLERCRKYFVAWQVICRRRKTFAYIRRTFPCGPPMMGANLMKLKNCSPKSMYTIQKENAINSRLLTLGLYSKILSEELKWSALDLANIVGPILYEKSKESFKNPFWKMALLPLVNDDDEESISSWLASKFSISVNDSSIENGIKGKSVSFERCGLLGSVNISTVLLPGSNLDSVFKQLEESQELRGLSALVLFLDPSLESDFKKFGKTLEILLTCFPLKPAISLAVVYMNNKFSGNMKTIISDLRLQRLVHKGKINSFITKIFSSDPAQNESILKNTIAELAESYSPLHGIETSCLRDFVEDGIRQFVFQPIFRDLAYKKERFKTLHTHSLKDLAGLYNHVIGHLSNVLCSKELVNLSWPPPEFEDYPKPHCINWNKMKHLNDLSRQLACLQIPTSFFKHRSPVGQPTDLWLFVGEAIGNSNLVVNSRIKDMLLQSPQAYIPIAQIFAIVVSEILSTNDIMLMETKDSEFLVHYFKKDYYDFHLPDIWIDATKDSNFEIVEERFPKQIPKKRHSFDIISSIPIKHRIVSLKKSKANESKRLSLNLEEALHREVEASKQFSRTLQMVTNDAFDLFPIEDFVYVEEDVNYETLLQAKKYSSDCDADDLNESLKKLNSFIASQMDANKIFEKKLKNLLDADELS